MTLHGWHRVMIGKLWVWMLAVEWLWPWQRLMHLNQPTRRLEADWIGHSGRQQLMSNWRICEPWELGMLSKDRRVPMLLILNGCLKSRKLLMEPLTNTKHALLLVVLPKFMV